MSGAWLQYINCRNPGSSTVEEDLLAAMCKARAFPECMAGDVRKVHEVLVPCCVCAWCNVQIPPQSDQEQGSG